MDQSNSNVQELNKGISAVELAKIPLEKRWRFIEDDLKANGFADIDEASKLDIQFSNYCIALYYMYKEQCASACALRALHDFYQPILQKRRSDSEGMSLMATMLSSFFAKCAGINTYLEFSNYLKENFSSLHVLIPSYPLLSTLSSPEIFERMNANIGRSDMVYLLNGLRYVTADILMRTEYRPRLITRALAAERFLESYGIEDPFGALNLAQVDVKDMLRRISRYVKDEVIEESFDEDGQETIRINPVESRPIPFVQSMIEMLSVHLKRNGLPDLNFEQRSLFGLYLLSCVEVWGTPILCENTVENIRKQESVGNFDFLRDLDKDFFEDPKKFNPEKLISYHDPREVFGNCVYDTLNDFVMPMNATKDHPAYKDEQHIRKVTLDAVAKNKPSVTLHFRVPQPMGDTFEHEIWNLYSLEELGLADKEYHGRQPMQGWKMVWCRSFYESEKSAAKTAVSSTAEHFKGLRTKFFEQHSEDVLKTYVTYPGQELDVVKVLKDNFLDNYSLGILVGARGTMPGFVKTYDLKPESGISYLINGQHLRLPLINPSKREPEIYLCSMPCNFESLVRLLSMFDFGKQIVDFYHHRHPERFEEIDITKEQNLFQEFEELRGMMFLILRLLHSRQSESGGQVGLHFIKSVMHSDLYYQIDGSVLTALVYEQARRTFYELANKRKRLDEEMILMATQYAEIAGEEPPIVEQVVDNQTKGSKAQLMVKGPDGQLTPVPRRRGRPPKLKTLDEMGKTAKIKAVKAPQENDDEE